MRSYLTSTTLLSALFIVSAPAHGQFPCNIAIGFQTLQKSTGCGNVGIGPATTLDSNTTGYSNTGVGDGALHLNVNGFLNTALGSNALSDNVSGSNNTAVGFQALFSNSTGWDNVATGYYALAGNTSGNFNTAAGYFALAGNTGGVYNTASGTEALKNNAEGSSNTADGSRALHENTSGNYNTAIGISAMYYNDSASNNTAIGQNALGTNRGGSNNVAVGSNAGYQVRGGNYNIEIGNDGTANDAGTIRIGTSSQQGTTYIAGIVNSHLNGSAVYVAANGQLGVLPSSERYKTDVASMGSGSERIRDLRPVTYHLKTDRKGQTQYGLIAEEVAKVYPELVIRGQKGEIEGVRYEELTPMLLNELQLQQGRLADQQSRLAEQQAELQDMRSQVTELRRAMQERAH